MNLKPRQFKFSTSVRWTEGHQGNLFSEGKPKIEIACPPVFCGGPDSIWTPEEFFVASVEACIMMTFVWLAEKQSLQISSYKSRAEGTAQVEKGTLRFTTIRVYPEIGLNDADSVEKAKDLLLQAEKRCLVSRSLFTRVEISSRVEILK